MALKLNDVNKTTNGVEAQWRLRKLVACLRDNQAYCTGMRVDERHTSAYIVKGNICLTLNRPEAAVMAFRKAQLLKPDLRSYQGLVRSYLAIPKHKEALYAAREAVKAMPQSAKALTLVGDVYAHHPAGRDKGSSCYALCGAPYPMADQKRYSKGVQRVRPV